MGAECTAAYWVSLVAPRKLKMHCKTYSSRLFSICRISKDVRDSPPGWFGLRSIRLCKGGGAEKNLTDWTKRMKKSGHETSRLGPRLPKTFIPVKSSGDSSRRK